MTNDKLFWEKFGFKWVARDSRFPKDDGILLYPDGTEEGQTHECYPEPTLDNLFRYCEEKTLEKLKDCWLTEYGGELTGNGARDLLFRKWIFHIASGIPHAIALKKAIEEIVK